ncbi:MAG: DUF4976 domain-containing protein, partial [Planctomycetota bacterium]|nr:DUF4976 domain-containing protein [Planctomycetota bacterium]
TSCIDVMPTILDALGIEPPEPLPGRSVRPLLEGNADNWRTHMFCEWTTSHPFPLPSFLFPQRSVRDERYKLIETLLTDQDNPVGVFESWRRPKPVELYDLHTDPCEFNDLSENSDCDAIKNALLNELRNWQQETDDPLADPEKLARLVEENMEVQGLRGEHRKPEFQWRYVDYLYK